MSTAHRVLSCGLFMGLLPLVLSTLPQSEPDQLRALVWGYGLASLAYLYIWAHWRSLESTKHCLWKILGVSAGCHFLLLFAPPLLSEDLWRYLWDGCVQWAGINPYGLAPNDPQLDVVAMGTHVANIRSLVGHPHIPTIYPPTAQMTFLGISAISPHPMVLRLVLSLANLGITVIIWKWAQYLNRSPHVAILYALAPLPMFESAIGGHIDVLGAFLMVSAAYALARGLTYASGALVGLSIGVKLAPAMVIPALLRRWPKAALLSLLTFVTLCIPYLSAGSQGLGGLRSFAHRWEGNGSIFAILKWPLNHLYGEQVPIDLAPWFIEIIRSVVGGSGGGAAEVQPDEFVFGLTKLMVLVLFGIGCLIILYRSHRLEDAFAPCMMLLCLVSPILHPWYLVWVVPFAVMAESGRKTWWSQPAILWCLLAWIAYLPRASFLETGVWQASAIGGWMEYLPVYALMTWQVWRVRWPRQNATESA